MPASLHRTVLITGASRGIGAATARACARRGFDVALNCTRNADAAQAVAADVRRLGRRAEVIVGDVSQEAEVLGLFAEVDRLFDGSLFALVNNAGVVDVACRVEDMSLQRLQRMFGVNVIGSMLCAREAVRRMSTARGGAGGCIVNLSSKAAVLGAPGQYVDYAASKGAIDSFTVGLAREVAAQGIRVNAVRPGIVDTEIHASGGDADRARSAAAGIPMQRAGRPDEIAAAIVWLLGDEASYASGTILEVTGGR